MERRLLIKKSILAIAIFVVYFLLEKVFYPVMTNEQALRQFEDSNRSFVDFEVYRQFWNCAWLIPVAICIIIFWYEIKYFYYKLKGGF